jgi:hypothetical protein
MALEIEKLSFFSGGFRDVDILSEEQKENRKNHQIDSSNSSNTKSSFSRAQSQR